MTWTKSISKEQWNKGREGRETGCSHITCVFKKYVAGKLSEVIAILLRVTPPIQKTTKHGICTYMYLDCDVVNRHGFLSLQDAYNDRVNYCSATLKYMCKTNLAFFLGMLSRAVWLAYQPHIMKVKNFGFVCLGDFLGEVLIDPKRSGWHKWCVGKIAFIFWRCSAAILMNMVRSRGEENALLLGSECKKCITEFWVAYLGALLQTLETEYL